MRQTKRLRNAVDILKTVPEMVGYLPQNSLVIIPLVHGHGRACIRIDLPTSTDEVTPEEYAIYVVQQIAQLPDANQVLTIVFTGESIAGRRVPFSEYQQALRLTLELFGLNPRGTLTCAANGWSTLDGAEHGSLEDLGFTSSEETALSFDEYVAIGPSDVKTRQSLRQALETAASIADRLDLAAVLFAWETLTSFDEAIEPVRHTVLQSIITIGLRDLLMTECLLANAAYGSDVAEELERVWTALDHDDEQNVDGLITDRLETEPISLTRVSAGIALLRELIAALPEADAVYGYAALSWLEWARGSSSIANHYASEALSRNHDNPLALAVAIASESGVTPGWISEVGVTGGFTDGDFDALLGASQ